MGRSRLLVIPGGKEAEAPVRTKRRKKIEQLPQCPNCDGRTYIEVKTGSLKQKACVFCLMKDSKIVEMC